MSTLSFDDVTFDERGLVPVVTQDARTGEVLMLAWANREALQRTLESRQGTYYSRSRQELWVKGLTSGHTQRVRHVSLDCDGDAVLYQVEQVGPACHTGERSCFHRSLPGEGDSSQGRGLDGVLERVYATIETRLREQPEGSYVVRLHAGGLDRVLKKVAEESGEVLLAAKNGDRAELATETADLLFHLLFALAEVGVTPADVAQVLEAREGKSGLRGPKEAG
ncbi:bifunctional phosphoribosyl-AMP cyclohydrolase/phosphoribosyl-ATP diphosphatase HisIE [Deinococcus peraridilitoris]|uniref:Histidine biosynthesis bifunctional protein HisIE n=1 Tax=Deinococcus peraridilitoris (strain DSM 19664 / LMG 22246 / CIP 109416 / KR-200) TaxID=937777 RepID=L0A5V9_DEIPD|nr:bifunctional phosphoribosyl-AMP cyclohydrolase/phosphoribosyl-ATP diphosphatase HisIE [Deinococcus peraridilitoris]AFZ68552.1 phosphoribosyl-ATP pyrophosphohydrolase [Deinococcus peraridilitoris DSM 19664]